MNAVTELSVSTLLLFAAFVVPGAVSLRVYTLKVSVIERPLKDSLIEAVVFSVVNFALLYWLIIYVTSEEALVSRPVQSYFMLMFALFAAPAFWPFAVLWALRAMEK